MNKQRWHTRTLEINSNVSVALGATGFIISFFNSGVGICLVLLGICLVLLEILVVGIQVMEFLHEILQLARRAGPEPPTPDQGGSTNA